MQSYGDILRKTREEKKISLEMVENDTAITIRYLQALENEDSDAFPGEPYLIGFLRNYSEYLGLKSETLVSLYRNKKIQESPVPEGLIEKRKHPYLIPVVAGSAVIIAVVVFLLVKVFVVDRKKSSIAENIAVSKTMNTHTYTLSDKPLEVRIYKGDHIIVPIHGSKVILTVANTDTALSLDTPVGTQIVDLSEELELDVDGDAVNDIIVYVSDVSSAGVERGAQVRMLLKTGDTDTQKVDVAKIPSAANVPEAASRHIVMEDNRAYPFTVNVSFRGSCVYRYQIDNDKSVESYYTSGEIVTMTASNGVRVWLSNGSAAKFQIIAGGKSFDLEVGKAGQVLVEDIRWIKDSDGSYKIVVIPVD